MPAVQTLVKGMIIFAVFVACLLVSYLVLRRRFRDEQGGAISLTLAQAFAGALLTIVVALVGGGATTVVVNTIPAFNPPRGTGNGLGPSATAGREAPRPPGQYAELVNVARTACLDVQDGSTVDAAVVVLGRCAGVGSQSWSLVSYGADLYKLVNQASGKCLDVQDRDRGDYAQVIQLVCYDSGGSQLWRGSLVSDEGGARYWRFRNVLSGRCLAPGFLEEVKQRDCADGQIEIWRTTLV